MPYQYKGEPLIRDEVNRLANACQTHGENFVRWTLLDTGLRVSELADRTTIYLNLSPEEVIREYREKWVVRTPEATAWNEDRPTA